MISDAKSALIRANEATSMALACLDSSFRLGINRQARAAANIFAKVAEDELLEAQKYLS